MAFFLGRKNTAESTIKINYNGKQAEKGLGGLKKTIATIITAEVLRRMALYTHSLALLGAEAESVEKNFKNFAIRSGRNIDEMTAKLRKATLGMVNDMELQQRAMQAMVSGVDFDDIITAMEFVTKFASATGTDVSSKMMTVMTGLARGSAQFLDDVGIQVIGSKDVVNDAIAQMKEKMDQFTTSEEDANVQSKQLKANLENLRIEIGRELIPALIQFNKLILAGVKGASKLIKPFFDMHKVIFSSKTLEDSRVENMIEQAKLLGDQSILIEAQKEKHKEIEKITEKIEKRRQSHTKAGLVDSDIERNLVGLYKQKNKLREQEIKIMMAIAKERRKDSLELSGDFVGPRRPKAKKIDPKEAEKAAKKAAKEAEKRIDQTARFLEDEWQEKVDINRRNQQRELQDLREFTNQRADALKELSNIGLTQEEINLKEHLELINMWQQNEVISTEEHQKFLTDIERQQSEERIKVREEEERKKIMAAQQGLSSASTINNAIIGMIDLRAQKELENIEKLNLSREEEAARREQALEESEEKRRAFARVAQGIAVAEAWVNTFKAGTGALSDQPGGALTRILAMGSTIASGALTVAKIQSQNFQTGVVGFGGIRQSRQVDDTTVTIGRGESIINAPATAANEDLLRSINNNTANTNRGLQQMRGGNIINNFYGVSTEEMLAASINIDRRKRIGRKL